MKKSFLTLLLILLTLSASKLEAGQIPYGDLFDRQQGSGKPVFFSNIVKMFGKEKGRFDLKCFVSMEYDRLHFVKKDSLFYAEYDLGVAIYADDGSDVPLDQKKSRHKVSVKKYTDTESRILKNIHTFAFDLPEGNYTVALYAKDVNSEQDYKVEEDLSFISNKALYAVTEPLIVQLKNQNFSPDSIVPLVSNVIDIKNDKAAVFFEVFADQAGLDYTISYEIVNYRGEMVSKNLLKRRSVEKINYEVIKLQGDSIEIGNYTMDLKIVIGGKTFDRSINFLIKWKEFFINFSDLREAVRQMAYIVPDDSLNKVLKGSDAEVESYFKTFWKVKTLELGGTNPLLEEYYRRIAFANIHFKTPKKQGWKTDMGQVFCIMGEPEEIQSFAFPKNQRPYETWVYYSKGQQYIFDYIGGEFMLRK